MKEQEKDGWPEWSRFVLKELERLNSCQADIYKKINHISVDIAMLKVKSGIWGSIGALIPIIVFIIYQIFKGTGTP